MDSPLLENYDLFTDVHERGVQELYKQEMAAIENILRKYIDDPIVGEITREKVKAAGIRAIIYDEDMDGKGFSEVKYDGNCVRLEMTSALIGVAQGDWLIAYNGLRRRLTEKEEAHLRHLEEKELLEARNVSAKN